MSPVSLSNSLAAPADAPTGQTEPPLASQSGEPAKDIETPEGFAALLAGLSALVAPETKTFDPVTIEEGPLDSAMPGESLAAQTPDIAAEDRIPLVSGTSPATENLDGTVQHLRNDPVTDPVPFGVAPGGDDGGRVEFENRLAQQAQGSNGLAGSRQHDPEIPPAPLETQPEQIGTEIVREEPSLETQDADSSNVAAADEPQRTLTSRSDDLASIPHSHTSDEIPEPTPADQSGDSLSEESNPRMLPESTISHPVVSAQNSSPASAFRLPAVETVSAGDIGEQLSLAIRQHAHTEGADGSTRFQTLLNPPDLGRVWIELHQTPEGMGAVVAFQDADVQQLVASQLSVIEEALGGQGVELKDFSLAADQQHQPGAWDQPEERPGSMRESNTASSTSNQVRPAANLVQGGLSLFA